MFAIYYSQPDMCGATAKAVEENQVAETIADLQSKGFEILKVVKHA